MHVIKLLMHNVFIHLCLSFGRIKHNEKEIQAKMKLCTGADVSLAKYFNRKLNTKMIGVTGDKLISSVTSSGVVKLLPLFRY